MPSERLYLRQLVAGRDFGRHDELAGFLTNAVYVVGDRQTRECVIVDAAWKVDELLAAVARDDMRLVGAVATHWHADHVGGDIGASVRPWVNAGLEPSAPEYLSEESVVVAEGFKELHERTGVTLHCHRDDAERISEVAQVRMRALTPHGDGDELRIGGLSVRLLHTPGHSGGSACYQIEAALLVGDTISLERPGSVDQPGGDAHHLFASVQRIGELPDEMVIYPGHARTANRGTLGELRRTNPAFSFDDPSAFAEQLRSEADTARIGARGAYLKMLELSADS